MMLGVIGHPIDHSKSPKIHSYWFMKNQMNGSYSRIDIAPEELKDGIKKLIDEGYKGFNVTIPHKEAIVELCDVVDETAQKIGAVNTVLIKDGKLVGINTDAYGFTQNIIAVQPKFSFKNKRIAVIGAGGAAKAILHGLVEKGASEIRLTNRTLEKANKLRDQFGGSINTFKWEQRHMILKNVDLLVNTTSLGMKGQPPLELDLDLLESKTIVNDIVYSPLMTDLLTQAKVHGNPYVTGIGMLLYQAQPAFKLWTGILPEVTQELGLRVLE